MKKLFTSILCLAAIGAFSQPVKEPEKKNLYQFVLLDHGLSAPKKPVTHKKDSSAWGDGPYQPFKVIKATDSVPARVNTIFGIEFKVTGTYNPDLHYTAEWVYPTPLKETDGKKYGSYKMSATLLTNKETSTSYLLEKSNELVLKGTWVLRMFIEGKLMHTQKFTVY